MSDERSYFEISLFEAVDILEYQRWNTPEVGTEGMTDRTSSVIEKKISKAIKLVREVLDLVATIHREDLKIKMQEQDRKRQRSAAGRVDSMRRKHPTLKIVKDPFDEGSKDVWEVHDSRIPFNGDGDPFEGDHLCFDWLEIEARCDELLSLLDGGKENSDGK